jgi:DNA-binding GntR family transcriptional regulator
VATRSESSSASSSARSGRRSYTGQSSSLRDHPNLKNIAADFIREEIVAGRFRPGTKIDQDDVATLLDISRLPVREALIELSEKDFVTSIPRRGAFVVDLGIEDIEDHFEVLGMVFAVAARRAAKALTREQLRNLRAIHEEIAQVDDVAAKEPLNHEFVSIVNQAGSSPRLLSILRSLSGALPARYYQSSGGWEQTEEKYRDRILAALESRDSDAASKIAAEHLAEASRVTLDELRGRGYWTSTDHASTEEGSRRRNRGTRARAK